MLFQQEPVQALQQVGDGVFFTGDPELAAYGAKQFIGGEAGVEDQCDPVGVLVELVEQGPEDRGLAGPDLAGHLDEPGVMLDPVKEMGKDLLVVLAEEDEPGVRGDGERFFLEPVVVEIH